MADDQAFLLPLGIDEMREDLARVPDRFRERQWMRLKNGRMPPGNIDPLVQVSASADIGAPHGASVPKTVSPDAGPGLVTALRPSMS